MVIFTVIRQCAHRPLSRCVVFAKSLYLYHCSNELEFSTYMFFRVTGEAEGHSIGLLHSPMDEITQ